MTESDEELIAAVAAGDRQAFGALYARRRPDVYRFALHMTGAPAAAEDVAQDVFLTVIHEAARYTPGRSGVAGVAARDRAGTTRGGDRRRAGTSRLPEAAGNWA